MGTYFTLNSAIANLCIEGGLTYQIIPVFETYLNNRLEKGVSKSTFIRHKSACHALGGYIVLVKYMDTVTIPFLAMNPEWKFYCTILVKMVGR